MPIPVPQLDTSVQAEDAMTLDEKNIAVDCGVDHVPTIEEIAVAIRKLTSEIDEKTELRAKLRTKLKKMAGEL